MDIMIDVKTLGQKPGCVILAIDYAIMDTKEYAIVTTDMIKLEVGAQLADGRTVCQDSHDIWMTHPADIRSMVFSQVGAVHPTEALHTNLSRVMQDNDVMHVWAAPTHFHIAIIDEAVDFWDAAPPWHYSQVRDLSSYIAAAGGRTDNSDSPEILTPMEKVTRQANSLFASMQELRSF